MSYDLSQPLDILRLKKDKGESNKQIELFAREMALDLERQARLWRHHADVLMRGDKE